MTDAAFGMTLGRHLRAYRLRFGPIPQLRAFMRLTILGDGVFRAELVPPDSIPTKPGSEAHVLWYSPTEGEALRRDMERLCLRVVSGGRPGRLKRRVAFLFDDDGQFTGWAN